MDAKTLVMALLRASGPSKELDRDIAIFSGYTVRTDTKPGEEFWTSPSQVDFLNLPKFTASIDAAFDLFKQTSPAYPGGLSWEAQSASARLADDRFMQAESPALALCASVVLRLALSQYADSTVLPRAEEL